MGILEIRNLTYEIEGKKILNDLNIDFWEGHIHAVVGPNGAGKSTLAYTIMGIPEYRKATGKILFMGKEINNLRIDERAKLGITLAWQEPARYDGLTIRKYLEVSAKEKNLKNIKHALSMVGLRPEDYLNRPLDKTLSGGERKRIELASIVVMEPRLVMLDEPDSGIDVGALDKIFEIMSFLKEKGTTVILITHSVVVLEHSEYAFLLCNGQIVDKGVTEKIVKYFKNKCLPCLHKNEPEIERDDLDD